MYSFSDTGPVIKQHETGKVIKQRECGKSSCELCVVETETHVTSGCLRHALSCHYFQC